MKQAMNFSLVLSGPTWTKIIKAILDLGWALSVPSDAQFGYPKIIAFYKTLVLMQVDNCAQQCRK